MTIKLGMRWKCPCKILWLPVAGSIGPLGHEKPDRWPFKRFCSGDGRNVLVFMSMRFAFEFDVADIIWC
jgi:hypothetical protein